MNNTNKLRIERRYRPPFVTLVSAAHAELLADALARGIREAAEAPEVTGRGAVHKFSYPEGRGIVRPCRRGGFVRHFTEDGYFFVNRPLKEFRVHCAAYERGLPVPEPLGVAWIRKGIVFHGALATQFFDMQPLSAYAKANHGKAEDAMRRAGALVRKVHDGGLYHADLNAGNILVDDDSAILIDLDKAQLDSAVSPRKKAANLRRLHRSLRKLDHAPEDFAAVCEGYGAEKPPPWLEKVAKEGRRPA